MTNLPCDAVELVDPANCSETGGPKWLTKEFGYYSKVGYKNPHHPSGSQHLLRGELLAYNYLHILLDAVYTIQDELTTKPDQVEQIQKSMKYFLI